MIKYLLIYYIGVKTYENRNRFRRKPYSSSDLLKTGKIILKKEKDFIAEDKKNVTEVIKTRIINYIEEIVKENKLTLDKIEMIGIAAPGTHREGKIVKAENLRIIDFDIVGILKKYLNYQNIYLRNDAKCAALCEKEYGRLKEYEDSIFICLGTGIGGAVFMDGKLLSAKRNEGFELGHIIINKNGEKCTCGNRGCFESYSSMRALKDKIAIRKNLKHVTGKDLYEIIKTDTDEIKDIIEGFIENLNIGLSSLNNIFEPEAICIGGSFVHYEDLLLKPLVDRMNEENLAFNNNIPEIVVAKMGNDAGMIGSTLIKK